MKSAGTNISMSMVWVLSRLTEIQLVVLEHHILVLAALIALDLLVLVDYLAGDGIDVAAPPDGPWRD